MANGATGRLNFIISLTDRLTSPIAGLQNQMDRLSSGATQAFANVGVGVAGLMGAGFAVKAALEPAIDMDRAMGEVRSLGVVEEDLLQLRNTAMDFSVEYGKSASEFVRASYDIQSAISGLTGEELGQFTKASGVLAAATKSDTATITSYMGTMYGIFSEQAAVMGNANWVNTVAGQTASAVQMFKTTGGEMAGAFTALGANATAAGIAMHEQMAILGRLQATMSGSEAGTKYKAFLSGVGVAQEKLGLKFTDSQDRLLPMADILDKLKVKFGDTLEVAESDALKKAFGSDEAVSLIKLLMKDVEGLNQNINDLGDINGLDKAEMMAMAQVDAWERFGAAVNTVMIGFGSALLPVINPVIDAFADMGNTLQKWTTLFPNVTRWVGYLFLGVMGLIAGMATLTLMGGLVYGTLMGLKLVVPLLTGAFTLLKWSLMLVGFASKILIWTFSLLPKVFTVLRWATVLLNFAWKGLAFTLSLLPRWATIVRWSFILLGAAGKALAFSMAVLPGLFGILKVVLLGTFSALGSALAFLLSPVGLIIAAIAAVGYGVYQMIQHWDTCKAVLQTVGQIIWDNVVGAFEVVLKVFSFLSPAINLLMNGFQLLGKWWDKLKATFADVGVFEFLGSIVDWVIDKINMIPGINIEIDKESLKPQIAKLRQPLTSQVPAGGLMKTINNNQQQHHQTTYQYNTINAQTVDDQYLANKMEMEAP